MDKKLNNIYSSTSLVWLLVPGVLIGCGEKKTFISLSPDQTKVDFVNEIIENDSFNILDFEYVYNGGGVAIADFNNDGLSDIYFTGNMVSNRLYLNKGSMRFEDVTRESGVGADEKWCSGVAVVDINADGWKDIYVCATVYSEPNLRENVLFVNQGEKNGVPLFVELAGIYGVNDPGHTTMASFFDYDKDGDLDLYLATNKMDEVKTPNVYKKDHTKAVERVDKLYRNDWDESRGHPVFTDVSKKAGIIYEGYSLGVNTSDIDGDGWVDIYVTNDYLTQDLLYINNRDGTFTNRSRDFLSHTSYSAMGNDVVDLNNDGAPDIIAVDMLPEDNYRKKTMLMSNNYMGYINNERYNYQYQCVRNTLQINQGADPVSGDPLFGDISLLAGISSTDWSWTPLVADFDNDGWKDLVITNGFPKDITDRDFSDYNTKAGRFTKKKSLLAKIPSVKITNYAYRNLNGLQFEDVSESWGILTPSFSNGAAYGDLDNDGDLDYVINNINDPAFIFQNETCQKVSSPGNWLEVALRGSGKDLSALGAKICLYYHDKVALWEVNPYRGYLSTSSEVAHFGLGASERVDSVLVIWPDQRVYREKNVGINQKIVITYEAGAKPPVSGEEVRLPETLFQKLPFEAMDSFIHREEVFIDFNVQPLLPHKLSELGPGLAVGDVNGDGLEDLYVSGSRFIRGTFLVQQPDNSFEKQNLFTPLDESLEYKGEELGSLLFDVDGDMDLDLYLVHGSYEMTPGHQSYQDRLWENVGGRFEYRPHAIPHFLESGSCVKAADFDRDGDLDLFVGGRQIPQNYPLPATSYILKNDSDPERISFSVDQASQQILKEMGMVTDALWTDFDNDELMDLVIVGEWMPVTFLHNTGSDFENITARSGVAGKVGWWNSLVSGDFDSDGDIDYIAGNLGLNTLNKASENAPIGVYAGDFDGNGSLDALPTIYWKDRKGALAEFPFFVRNDVVKQLTRIRGDFKLHAEFGKATISDILSPEQMKKALVYKAGFLESAFIENMGNGRFRMSSLPVESQIAPVFGMMSEDFDGDGLLDVLLVGNDYGTEVLQGRYDAFKGLWLQGRGDGTFTPKNAGQTGFLVPGDARALTYIVNPGGGMQIIASQNKQELCAFSIVSTGKKAIDLEPLDVRVTFEDPSGSTYIREAYYGHSYLSQGSRRLMLPMGAKKIMVTDSRGNSRMH